MRSRSTGFDETPDPARSPDPSPSRQPAAPTEANEASDASAERRGKDPLLFTLVWFGLPLLVIILAEFLRVHG